MVSPRSAGKFFGWPAIRASLLSQAQVGRRFGPPRPMGRRSGADMSVLAEFLAADRPYVTDGGLETDLIFNGGFDLPLFSAFVLLTSTEGRAGLERYFDRYLDLADAGDRGFLLDTATWRANMGWAGRHGLSEAEIRAINRDAVRHAKAIRARRDRAERILVNGCIGPAGDGYAPDRQLDPVSAEKLHRPQAEALAAEGVDLATAMTMTHVGEAIGVVRAATAAGLPIAISFTVETDGRLPVGMTLGEAITAVDHATAAAPIYYGINCAHPSHFLDGLQGAWTDRIGLIRANASALSHAELDAAETLDTGDPEDFGQLCGQVQTRLSRLLAVGGCCGCDHRHVGAAVAAT